MERIPILKMGEFLLVTIQVDMHDRLALALQDDLTDKIAKTGARGVLIDISALEMVDSLHRADDRQHRRHGPHAGRARRWWSGCSRRWPSRWWSWG